MNTRRPLDNSKAPAALSVSLNDDKSFFSVGLEDGFRIYNARTCDAVASQVDLNGGIGSAEMVDRTNFLALVGGGKQPKFPQNKVIIWDDRKKTKVLTLEFRAAIQRVRISRTHIVVVLLNSVNLYKFSTTPEKLGAFETTNNPFGLCCLGKRLLCFPGRTPGHVQLVELASRNISILPAHSAPLRALDLSPDEAVCATASEKGTLLRVWSTANCSRLAELRRGVDPAAVFSLAISPNSTYLAVTSDKSTLHLFDLPPLRGSSGSGGGGGGGGAGNRAASPSIGGSDGGGPNWEVVSSEGYPLGAASNANKKYGIFSTMPLMPRVVTDTYSLASAHFEIGEEPEGWTPAGGLGKVGASPSRSVPIPGVPGGRPPKGVIGWLNDETMIVLGAGHDARWEQFSLRLGEEGRRFLARDGWRRYME
ncbi:putative phosphatidylinositol 3,5-bisphosphate-binding protein [Viridothelium virens]|uniref:Putative phosphatidylinositol 3,5-bisphosphate-binding protein n=1 Tax=Viridothelium virens TaxID=1048519 RepID=A0A6A6HD13_VIRVR|nr:putative phosphatidylinositol 3,5-bisphosphate-binding protein [Viridothelium virens]